MINCLAKTIVALDQMSDQEIDQFLSKHDNKLETVKIGLELYLKYGRELVLTIHNKFGKKIFLDLKLHDIPKTVERAIQSLHGLPVDFLTVHISGGEEMLKSALRARDEALPQTKILGVSFLTSLEEVDLNKLYGIQDVKAAFERLFKMARTCGIDGVICSPHEIELVKTIAPELLAVTPGIRFSDEISANQIQDQKRVATPHEAIQSGADYIVMGRSLTKATDLSARLNELSC